ncbi:stage V sporulation protein AC [Alteribacter lacisalsi]|uniref:Stage V sporulation protein AC n=1 Tax=Alteribacter lacisalsi TaxID=2045244 RepID=A0A2W0HN23_9BACI|nr:stage V sporulation protein AC [Alteribacter lacisalsi]PYZ98482.1 stage V sporulation protein AC [Alteribacter lacisalsi]
MGKKKKLQNLTPEQRKYQETAQKHEIKRPVIANCIKAFLIGGLICTIGQAIQLFYMYQFDFTEKTAGNPTVATLIFIAVLLTGLGVYDRFAQIAGAGTAVPVTGFANSMASAAIEHRTEGYVLGVGGNMFKLAGSVIVFGTFAAFIIALILTITGFEGG